MLSPNIVTRWALELVLWDYRIFGSTRPFGLLDILHGIHHK
jgi:hypothetical protein